MKGLKMFLAPLFALPLLVGCKIGNLENQRFLQFTCANCHVIVDGEPHEDIAIGLYLKDKVEYEFKVDDNYVLLKDNVIFENTDDREQPVDATYDESTHKVKITVTANITITATATPAES